MRKLKIHTQILPCSFRIWLQLSIGFSSSDIARVDVMLALNKLQQVPRAFPGVCENQINMVTSSELTERCTLGFFYWCGYGTLKECILMLLSHLSHPTRLL